MAKKPDNSKHYDLLSVQNHEAEKRGGTTINFSLGAEEFKTPAPGFWSDKLKKLTRSSDDDDAFMVEYFGGEAELTRYRDAGGTSDMLGLLFNAYAEDQGTSLGE